MQHDAVRPRDAAARLLAVRRSQLFVTDAEVLQRPARLDLIVRQRAPVDRRAQRVALQRLGEALPAEARAPLDAGDAEPLQRVGPQDVANELLQAGGHVRRDGERAVEYVPLQLRDRLGAERHHAGEHEVEQDAERPHVDPHAEVVFVAEQLRRGVRRRATESAQRLVDRADDAEAEVAHLDGAQPRQEDVLRLQVAVDHAVLVLQQHIILLHSYATLAGALFGHSSVECMVYDDVFVVIVTLYYAAICGHTYYRG